MTIYLYLDEHDLRCPVCHSHFELLHHEGKHYAHWCEMIGFWLYAYPESNLITNRLQNTREDG